jgi:hypothetical protein
MNRNEVLELRKTTFGTSRLCGTQFGNHCLNSFCCGVGWENAISITCRYALNLTGLSTWPLQLHIPGVFVDCIHKLLVLYLSTTKETDRLL